CFHSDRYPDESVTRPPQWHGGCAEDVSLERIAQNGEYFRTLHCALEFLSARASPACHRVFERIQRVGRFQSGWLCVWRITPGWLLRIVANPSAIRAGRPGNPGLSRRIKAKDRDAVIVSKWKTIHVHPSDSNIAANHHRDVRSTELTRSADCVIKLKSFAQRSFALVLPRG